MKRLYWIVGVFAVLSAGCVHPPYSKHPHGMPPGQAKKVVHAHGHDCGHVFVGGNWVTSIHPYNAKKGKGHKK